MHKEPSSQHTLLGWAPSSPRDTQLDLPPPEACVRTSLAPGATGGRGVDALVLYRPPAPEDDSLFARCVIEDPPVRSRSRRGTWLAVAAGVGAVLLALALAIGIEIAGRSNGSSAQSGGPDAKAAATGGTAAASKATATPRSAPAPAPHGSRVEGPAREAGATPSRARSRGLEVRVDRARNRVEIWLREG